MIDNNFEVSRSLCTGMGFTVTQFQHTFNNQYIFTFKKLKRPDFTLVLRIEKNKVLKTLYS